MNLFWSETNGMDGTISAAMAGQRSGLLSETMSTYLDLLGTTLGTDEVVHSHPKSEWPSKYQISSSSICWTPMVKSLNLPEGA